MQSDAKGPRAALPLNFQPVRFVDIVNLTRAPDGALAPLPCPPYGGCPADRIRWPVDRPETWRNSLGQYLTPLCRKN